ncbi:MAG TPA: Fic family protein [Lachnospiraceae bacterium]|nr:Fic family protein [Lachnospiraceae bacterium]
MEAKTYVKMLQDDAVLNLRKLQYKYTKKEVDEFLELQQQGAYEEINLMDFNGKKLFYLKAFLQVNSILVKKLALPRKEYGKQAMETEVYATLDIESIHSSRESIWKIFNGYAPDGRKEERIFGMKKGLAFISNLENKITEDNIYQLYSLTVGDFLEEENRLRSEERYRHDTVFIVGNDIEHTGIDYQKLPQYMKEFVAFIQEEDGMNELLKGAAIHFYLAYLHPYFDGNGRMARLLHLWYLVQRGYSSVMFVSLSYYISQSKKEYYRAYQLVEENKKLSGVLDITPFLYYFINNVYEKIQENVVHHEDVLKVYEGALSAGKVTEKERDLWQFVLSAYGEHEFSTKQLEKAYGEAAYATIRSFVLKFEELGILRSQRYGNRVRYKIKIE